jgi:hypothetical protein
MANSVSSSIGPLTLDPCMARRRFNRSTPRASSMAAPAKVPTIRTKGRRSMDISDDASDARASFDSAASGTAMASAGASELA